MAINDLTSQILARDRFLYESGLLDEVEQRNLARKQAQAQANADFMANRRTYADLAPTVGAIAGGAIAAPFTAGASLPAALAIAGGAGAIGGGLGGAFKERYDANPDFDFGNVLEEAAISGGFNAAGLGLGRALQIAQAGGGVDDLVRMSGDDIGSFLAGSKASRVAGFADEALGATDDSGKLASATGRSTSKGVRGKINDAGVRRFFNLNKSNVKPATEVGKNPLEIGRNTLSKLGLGVDDYDDALGSVATRGQGGKIGTQLSANGNKIRAAVRGKKVDVGSFYDDLAAKADDFRNVPAGESKAAFLDDIVAQRPANTLIDAEDAYDLKILLDEKFGRAIAAGDELTATADDVQKLYGNTIRGQLKLDKTAASLLDENQDLVIARELLSDARDALGIAGQRAVLQSLSPQGAVSAVMRKPTVARTLARFGEGGAAQGGRMATLSNALAGLSPTATAAGQQLTGQFAGRGAIEGLLDSFDPDDPIDAEIMADIQEAMMGGGMGGGMDAIGFDPRGESADNQITNSMIASGQLPQSQFEGMSQPNTLAGTLSDPAIIQQMMFQDLQQTGGENIGALNAIFEMGQLAGGGGASELSSSQEKALTQFSSAEAVLDELLQDYEEAGGGQGRVGGTIANVAGGIGLNDKVSIFNQRRTAAMSLLARALGEVGVLTDQDIKRALGNVPRIEDNPAEARGKIEGIYSLLANLKQIALQNPGAVENETDALVQEYNSIGL